MLINFSLSLDNFIFKATFRQTERRIDKDKQRKGRKGEGEEKEKKNQNDRFKTITRQI